MSLYTDAKYDITIMMVFTVIGIVVKMFFAQPVSADGSTGPANATIWGYGIIALALFCTTVHQIRIEQQRGSCNPYRFINQSYWDSL